MNRMARLWTRATISLRASLKRAATSRTLAAALVIAILLAVSPALALAVGITPVPGSPPVTTQVAIADGAARQIDPHVSGTLVSYTEWSDRGPGIRYYVFATAQTGSIPRVDGLYDHGSDVSGSKIAFIRSSESGSQGIYVFDVNDPGAGTQEVDPRPDSFPLGAAIGNGTIVWGDLGSDHYSQPEIRIYDPAEGTVVALTDDTTDDLWPAVSEDGAAVAWVKCASTGACDVYSATRSGDWIPVQVTGADGNESYPATNGEIVVYVSSQSGGDDIHWLPIGGGTDTWLDMPGVQRNPSISGDLIAFESNYGIAGAQYDIYVYDVSQGLLYQLTDTPFSEERSDISVGADGEARVAWEQEKQAYPFDMDVHGLSFDPPHASLTLPVEPLFDQTQARRAGSVVPIRLQVLDSQGNNISSPSLVLTVTGLVHKDGSAVTSVVEDAGNANPYSAFRFDESLEGYAYNLGSKRLSVGSWELQFTARGDPATTASGSI